MTNETGSEPRSASPAAPFHPLPRYIHQETRLGFFLDAIRYRIEYRLYKYLTRGSSPLYLKPRDYLSWSPTLAAIHEREVVLLLKALAEAGCRDALVDIGANIGLTTFYCRPFFHSAYCFEPNPRVFSVLTANLYDSLGENTTLFNFGLGDRDDRCELTVPRYNAGGGFIRGAANTYTLQELAGKDGFGAFDERNYEKITVHIRKGREVLGEIFAEGKRNIVIKVDVEGYEETVLTEIAAVLPRDGRFAIVFENWSASFDPKAFAARSFSRPVKAYKLATTVEPEVGKVWKLWDLLLHSRRYFLTDSPQSWIGTVVYADPAVRMSPEGP